MRRYGAEQQGPVRIAAAKGNTKIQRSELATTRRGSMNIVLMFYFSRGTAHREKEAAGLP
jgi:hypothetical protein